MHAFIRQTPSYPLIPTFLNRPYVWSLNRPNLLRHTIFLGFGVCTRVLCFVFCGMYCTFWSASFCEERRREGGEDVCVGDSGGTRKVIYVWCGTRDVWRTHYARFPFSYGVFRICHLFVHCFAARLMCYKLTVCVCKGQILDRKYSHQLPFYEV